MGSVVQYLDVILVPSGLLIMFIYHLYLLYRILTKPATTVIGYDNKNWMAWVQTMMKDSNYTSVALTVMSNNSSGAIYLASMCLSLTAFIGVWVGSSGTNAVSTVYILGNTSSATISLKNISTIFAFMLAFGAFIQSTRFYVQANSLISMPNTDVPVNFVQGALIRGNNYWELGLRVLYLALSLLLWSFGPIPMFACCVIMVIILYFLDFSSVPLHRYRPVPKPPMPKPPVKKAVEEVAAAVRAVEHRREKVVE